MEMKLDKQSKNGVFYNRIFSFDGGCDWVLEVGRLKPPEKVISYDFEGLKRVAAEAYNIQPGKDGKVYVWKALKAHIETVGVLAFPSGTSVIPTNISKRDHRYNLTNVLYAIYSEISFRDTDGLEIDLRRKYPENTSITGEYAEYLRTHTVYELSENCLYNSLKVSPDGIGKIRVLSDEKQNIIRLCHRSKMIVETEYNETLDYIFKAISAWETTTRSHLRIKINDTPISTAEMICGYYMGYLSDNLRVRL